MTSSLTYVAILFVINFLFLSNFWFVWKLRKTVNECSSSNIDDDDSSTQQQIINSRLECIRDTVYAAILGRHRLQLNTAEKFPNWQQIPYNLGIWSTSLTLLLATGLLSGGVLLDKVSVTVNKDNSTSLCAADFDAKIADFESHIKSPKVSNFRVGSKQHNKTLEFRDALLSDTTLYGTDGFECSDKQGIGSKDSYRAQKKHLEYGPYFPGFCGAARELALHNAMTATCIDKIWVCVDDCAICACIVGKHVEVPIPCPPHTYDSEVADVTNYRIEQRKRIEREEIKITSDVTEDDLNNIQDNSAILIKKLLKQIDIAGTFYSVYVCIALFFPTPLRLYRPSLLIQLQQFVFGAGKFRFIASVLIIWWFYEYIGLLVRSPQVKIYLKNLFSDPCFVDGEFISRRYKILRDTCSTLMDFEKEWGLAKVQIDGIKPEVESFYDSDACGCKFPGRYLFPLFADSHLSVDRESMWNIGFDNLWNVVAKSSKSSVWSPRVNSTFLGNETICVDREYAMNEVLVASEADLNFWELWIASGLLANLVVKIAIAQFGVALLKVADPFTSCKGMYECPPTLNQNDGEHELFVDGRVKEIKEAALRTLAIRESIIWGFISNSCLLSLVVVAIANVNNFKTVDYIFFSIIMALTVSLPFVWFKMTFFVKRMVESEVQQSDE